MFLFQYGLIIYPNSPTISWSIITVSIPIWSDYLLITQYWFSYLTISFLFQYGLIIYVNKDKIIISVQGCFYSNMVWLSILVCVMIIIGYKNVSIPIWSDYLSSSVCSSIGIWASFYSNMVWLSIKYIKTWWSWSSMVSIPIWSDYL